MATDSSTSHYLHDGSRKRNFPIEGQLSEAIRSLACQRCRAQKVKCDTNFPSCTRCSKVGAPCIVADGGASRQCTRLEVYELEERVASLQSLLTRAPEQTTGAGADQTQVATRGPERKQRNLPTPNRLDKSHRFVGSDGGLSFTRYIYATLRKHHSRATLRNLFASNSPATHVEYCSPHSLPPWQETAKIIANYFETFHNEHPFLDPTRIWRAAYQLYEDSISNNAESKMHSRATRQALFKVNMTLALGSIGLFRDKKFEMHPFGFFTAALQAIAPSGFSFDGIEDVENFLLIANFGVFYHTGCSIWELSQLCMRICIELRLNCRGENTMTHPSVEEQRRRKLFWECYRLDLFASLTLGRPPGIDERDIDTDFPSEDNASVSLGARSNGDMTASWDERVTGQGSDVVVFNHLLRLAQIASRINHDIISKHSRPQETHAGRNANIPGPYMEHAISPGDLYALLKTFDKQLKEWLDQAPIYARPTCLYQMPIYFELAYQKERMSLLRVIIDRISSNGTSPSDTLLNPCVNSALKIPRIYDTLRDQNLLSCTRSATHLILSAGLVLVSAALRTLQTPGNTEHPVPEVAHESWWTLGGDEPAPSFPELLSVLETTSNLLLWFSNHMPDMAAYALFFDTLRLELPSKPPIGREELTDEFAASRNSISLHRPSSDWSARGIDDPHTQASHDSDPLSEYRAFNGVHFSSSLNQIAIDDRFMRSQNPESRATEAGGNDAAEAWLQSADPGSHAFWPFHDSLQSIEHIELALSGLEWDTIIPWNTPTATMASE